MQAGDLGVFKCDRTHDKLRLSSIDCTNNGAVFREEVIMSYLEQSESTFDI